jgi:hypothetical protein
MTKNVRKVIDAAIAGGHYEMAARYLEMEARKTGRPADIAAAREMRARVSAC